MQKTMLIGVLMCGLACSSPLFGQTNLDDVAQLKERVSRLELQVQEMSQLLEPMKAQLAVESRRKALREKFEAKMSQDRQKYTSQQLEEAESLYQIANQKWGTPEAISSLHGMIEKYPDINRTGCAVLYVAQNSEGEERAKYLKDCIEKYDDCFYGDGVQVGAYARYMLAGDYQARGESDKAQALYEELKLKYPAAVNHGGHLLVDDIKSGESLKPAKQ